jgi:polysaccharide chain length determinant protein (PEP-CTERM system associated)
MNSSGTPVGDLVRLLVKEGRRRIVLLTAIFSVVAVAVLAIGLVLPKRYDASTVIIVESSNIVKPLLDGRAVATGITDQVAIASQVILSKRILREVLAFGGWMDPPPDPREEERKIMRLRSRIKIESVREELVRISYRDTDPQRCYRITNKLAEIYIRESNAAKIRESREAFDFIDKQVKEYGEKLTDAHEKVLAYYRGVDARATSPTPTPDPTAPTVRPPASKISPEELAKLRAEEATLTAQLAKKPSATNTPRVDGRLEEQYRQRVLQLEIDLQRLRTTYTDEHPDVRRVQRELQNAQAELKRAEQARQDRETAAAAMSALDDQVTAAARARLDEVQRRIAQATGVPIRRRPIGGPPRTVIPEAQIDPQMRTVGSDTTLSELVRRYEATRDIYQDLLKRRENARVSMELDSQQRGLTLRVQEPAEVPLTPTGLRLMHFSAIGLVLALLVPFGILFAIVRFDPRVRSATQIERLAKVPLLVSIPYTPAARDRSRDRSRTLVVALMLTMVFAVYIGLFVFKLKTAQ